MKINSSVEGNSDDFMPGKSRFDFLQCVRDHLLLLAIIVGFHVQEAIPQ